MFPFPVLLLYLIFICCYSESRNFNSCKKHLSMELKCLFQYIVNQLKKGLGTELVVVEVCWLCRDFLAALVLYEV